MAGRLPRARVHALPDDLVRALLKRRAMEDTLRHELDELRSNSERWHQLATTDPLTGLANRRAVEDRLTEEWDRALRYGHPLTVILADIDGLKMINDRFGHALAMSCFARWRPVCVGWCAAVSWWSAGEGTSSWSSAPKTNSSAAREVAGKLIHEGRRPVDFPDLALQAGLSVG